MHNGAATGQVNVASLERFKCLRVLLVPHLSGPVCLELDLAVEYICGSGNA